MLYPTNVFVLLVHTFATGISHSNFCCNGKLLVDENVTKTLHLINDTLYVKFINQTHQLVKKNFNNTEKFCQKYEMQLPSITKLFPQKSRKLYNFFPKHFWLDQECTYAHENKSDKRVFYYSKTNDCQIDTSAVLCQQKLANITLCKPEPDSETETDPSEPDPSEAPTTEADEKPFASAIIAAAIGLTLVIVIVITVSIVFVLYRRKNRKLKMVAKLESISSAKHSTSPSHRQNFTRI